MPGDLPHYTDDPLIDAARTQHGLLLEQVGTTRSLFGATEPLYAAACAHGDWMDPRQYGDQAHHEGFDQHMSDVQRALHTAQPQETTDPVASAGERRGHLDDGLPTHDDQDAH